MKRTLWISALVVALLGLTCLAFAASGQEDGWAGSPLAGAGPNGEAGTTRAYWTNWVATSGQGNWQGWWDNDDSRWVPVGVGGDTGLVVEAYVELYASQTQQTTAVFHWGQPPFAAMNAVLAGNMVSNHPCWVGIRKDGWVQGNQDKASKLHQVAAFGGTGPKPNDGPYAPLGDDTADIPLTWLMNVNGGAYAAMQWTGGTNQSNWGWYSAGRVPVGANSYNFLIQATPAAYQADGKYEIDPDVIVVPDL